MKIPRLVYSIISIILMLSVGTAIGNFFGFEFNTYGPYLLWFVALSLFYGFLPVTKGSIFSNMSDG